MRKRGEENCTDGSEGQPLCLEEIAGSGSWAALGTWELSPSSLAFPWGDVLGTGFSCWVLEDNSHLLWNPWRGPLGENSRYPGMESERTTSDRGCGREFTRHFSQSAAPHLPWHTLNDWIRTWLSKIPRQSLPLGHFHNMFLSLRAPTWLQCSPLLYKGSVPVLKQVILNSSAPGHLCWEVPCRHRIMCEFLRQSTVKRHCEAGKKAYRWIGFWEIQYPGRHSIL